MLALAQWRDEDLCPCGCGWSKVVAQDPMTEFGVEVIRGRCHVRTALSRVQTEYAQTPGAIPEGALWSTRLKDPTPSE